MFVVTQKGGLAGQLWLDELVVIVSMMHILCHGGDELKTQRFLSINGQLVCFFKNGSLDGTPQKIFP